MENRPGGLSQPLCKDQRFIRRVLGSQAGRKGVPERAAVPAGRDGWHGLRGMTPGSAMQCTGGFLLMSVQHIAWSCGTPRAWIAILQGRRGALPTLQHERESESPN